MNYDFFADKTDKIKILEFIFKETDLRIFDLSSLYEQEICEYKNVNEINSKFDLDNESKCARHFNLWSPSFKGGVLFRRVGLNPKYSSGKTFRYDTAGWGLIQLYFGELKNNILSHSHIGHFNEKGALQWEKHNSFNGSVGDWDWKEIQRTSRKLKHQIHNKMAIRKIGSSGVLNEADNLEKQGVKLW